MAMHPFPRDGLMLMGQDAGQGPPIIFQHGLGGDEAQIAEAFPAEGFRRLTLECRSHGSSAKGDRFSIAMFADDILAYADARGVGRFALGGISMGAAIASRLAVIAPERISSLILVRPAWTWYAAPPNMQVFAKLSRFLVNGDRDGFEASDVARKFGLEAPDNLASLRKFFDVADPANTARLLSAIATDGPGIAQAQLQALDIPTLVIGNAIDLVHPLEHAQALAALIPQAQFIEITPKALDKPLHLTELRAAIGTFLKDQGSKP